ncbi:MAG: hypothetical protein IJ960_04560 [Oscillospiraceae bacterium]|nr:hypothetical protein [Oscillospiraceae bacterium]
MEHLVLYIPILTNPLLHAARILADSGVEIASDPESADYLLYPIPTPLSALEDYCQGATIIGGNLDFLNESVSRIDLLKDPFFLADNAAITAEAALGLVLANLPCAVTEGQILILGWGRIGKCLTHQLEHLNAPVSVFARKPEDRALLRSLGYRPIGWEGLADHIPEYRCVINTIPAQVLSDEDARRLRGDCFRLDLASVRSIPGEGVLHARGLPGKYKPESTGKLIARTILHDLGRVNV